MDLGNQNDMREMIETLDKIESRIANLYARRASRDPANFLILWMPMKAVAGFWDSTEAKEFGLIDTQFEPKKAAASFDPRMLNAMGITLPADSPLSKKADYRGAVTAKQRR